MRRAPVYDVPGLVFLLRDLRHMNAKAAPDLTDWLIYLDLEGRSGRTLYSYHRELARLLRAHPNHQVDEFTAAEISAVLREIPPRSRHISRSIYSKFFEWAMLMDRVQVSPMFKVAKIKNPPRRTRDIFTVGEVMQLEALPTPDGGLFTILFETGIRKAEARWLRRENLDLGRRYMRVLGKGPRGGKERLVVLTPNVMQAVEDMTTLEGLNPEDHLWACKPGGGTMVSRRWPIGDTTFSRWYSKCIDAAGVPYLSPHTTRHTYHELMRGAGLELDERQVMMGHESSRTTTDIYGHANFADIADKLADFKLENL